MCDNVRNVVVVKGDAVVELTIATGREKRGGINEKRGQAVVRDDEVRREPGRVRAASWTVTDSHCDCDCDQRRR